MNDAIRHLTDDQIQEWLDGRLDRPVGARLEAHLEACARCRVEVEAWRAVITELAALAPLAPPPGFGGRVLDAVGRHAEAKASLADRVRGWLTRSDRAKAHPGAAALQDFLDGALRGGSARTVRAHLAACSSCRTEARAWSGVMESLAALPQLAPEAPIADAVMARVRLPEPSPARAAMARRVLDRARAFAGPRRRRAWAAAAGIALAPAVTAALVAYTVFSHPLVTLGTIGSFVSIKAAALLGAAGSAVATALMQSAPLFRAWTVVGALTHSPATAGASLLACSGLTVVSAWVLYRNVYRAPVRAHATV